MDYEFQTEARSQIHMPIASTQLQDHSPWEVVSILIWATRSPFPTLLHSVLSLKTGSVLLGTTGMEHLL